MRKRTFTIDVALALLATMLISLTACSASSLKIMSSDITSREFTNESNIKSSMSVVTGTARNEANVAIRSCLISVTFYDAQGNRIGQASSSRDMLGPGETWNFTVQLTDSDAWKVRKYDISASNR